MENLQDVILQEFGLNLKLKPFGDNEARNNVFQGKNEDKSFIIKLEDAKQLEQVKLSIKVLSNLLKSDLVTSSRYLKTKKGEYFIVVGD